MHQSDGDKVWNNEMLVLQPAFYTDYAPWRRTRRGGRRDDNDIITELDISPQDLLSKASSISVIIVETVSWIYTFSIFTI